MYFPAVNLLLKKWSSSVFSALLMYNENLLVNHEMLWLVAVAWRCWNDQTLFRAAVWLISDKLQQRRIVLLTLTKAKAGQCRESLLQHKSKNLIVQCRCFQMWSCSDLLWSNYMIKTRIWHHNMFSYYSVWCNMRPWWRYDNVAQFFLSIFCLS